MNRYFSTRSFIAAALALGAAAAGSAAHARTDVTLVIDTPHRQVQSAPVFVQHQPYAVQPAVVYNGPRTVQFDRDSDRMGRRGNPMGDADRDGIPNRFDRDSRFYDARAARNHPQWGDFDRDGVVNQFDRFPRNPRRH